MSTAGALQGLCIVTCSIQIHQVMVGYCRATLFAYLLKQAPFQNLKDWHHHHRECKQQTQAQRQLHCNGGPVLRQVQGDDVPGLLPKCCIPNLHQQGCNIIIIVIMITIVYCDYYNVTRKLPPLVSSRSFRPLGTPVSYCFLESKGGSTEVKGACSRAGHLPHQRKHR